GAGVAGATVAGVASGSAAAGAAPAPSRTAAMLARQRAFMTVAPSALLAHFHARDANRPRSPQVVTVDEAGEDRGRHVPLREDGLDGEALDALDRGVDREHVLATPVRVRHQARQEPALHALALEVHRVLAGVLRHLTEIGVGRQLVLDAETSGKQQTRA